MTRKRGEREVPLEHDRDHGDEPITWAEIDADAAERPLTVRRRWRRRDVSERQRFDPRDHEPRP